MPKALRDFLGLSFYFWSNENSGATLEPIHIHVCKGVPIANATKIWLKQDGSIELSHNNSNLSPTELSHSMEYIKLMKAVELEIFTPKCVLTSKTPAC